MKREPSAWGYNRATLFLGDIRGPVLQVGGDSNLRDPGMTVLARTSSNCKRQGGYSKITMKASVQLKKILVVGLKGFGTKTN
jgi:hypothetical protein